MLSSGGRVRVDETDRTTYPDASVVCGPRQTSPRDRHAVTNPVVLVEVFSSETERDDRGEKFAHYRRLASLDEYVLVSQEVPRIEVFQRTPDGWMLREAAAGDRLTLRSIDVVPDVDAIYLDPPADPRAHGLRAWERRTSICVRIVGSGTRSKSCASRASRKPSSRFAGK